MNLKEILSTFKIQLKDIYDDSEILSIFYVVAEDITGLQRFQLLADQDISNNLFDNQKFIEVIEELKRGVPLQYILGSCYFYGLKLKVNPSVLIPRPETEELVHWIVENIKSNIHTAPGNILDIGTGSGCIAIALKLSVNDHNVSALDVSDIALQTAMNNAKDHHADIKFVLADIREYESEEQFDIIVSNPPYITMAEKNDMHTNVVNNEPHLALFVRDENPLEFYEAIARYASKALKPTGSLFFEINELFGKETQAMLERFAFKNVQVKKDMQGKDRMICCTL